MRSLLALLLVIIAACGGGDRNGAGGDAGDGDAGSHTLQSIELGPSSPHVAAGTQATLAATALYRDGTHQDITSSAAWSSSDASIATVAGGVVSGITAGSATITADLDGVSAAIGVTVTDATLVSLAITPPMLSLQVGVSRQLAATATFTDHTTQDVTAQVAWSSTDPTSATVSATGLVTGLAESAVNIGARFGNVTAAMSCQVQIAALVSLEVSTAAPIAAGFDAQLTATGHFSDGSTADLTSEAQWSASGAATVSTTGLMHGVSAGSAAITASVVIEGEVASNSAIETITAATLVSLAVSPPLPSVAAGISQRFDATGTFSDGSQRDLTTTVTWSSDSPAVAMVSNVSDSWGIASTFESGTVTITATLGAATGSTTLTVTAAVLQSISIAPASVAAGLATQLSATAVFSDQSSTDITTQATWATGDPSIAQVSNAAGSVGLASGLAQGSTSVTATFGGVTGTGRIGVGAPLLRSIAVSPANAELPASFTITFTAIGTFSDGSTGLVDNVTWSSSNPNIALFNGSPNIINASGNGEFGLITVTGVTPDGLSASTSLNVTQAQLASIVISPSDVTIGRGASFTLSAIGTFDDGATLDVSDELSWSSSDPSIAIAPFTLVTGVGPGDAQITASYAGTLSAAMTVHVEPVTIDIAFAGSGSGEVVVDVQGPQDQFSEICTSSCSIAVSIGDFYTLTATSPQLVVSMAGACNHPGAGDCNATAQIGSNLTTVTITPEPDELFTVELPEPAATADYDSAGNLIVGSLAHITKIDPSGAIVWQVAVPGLDVRVGPGDVIDVEECENLTQLDHNGVTQWSTSLGSLGAPCPTFVFPDVHEVEVAANGDVVTELGGSLQRWSGATGALLWSTAVAVNNSSIAIDSTGTIWTMFSVEDTGDNTELHPYDSNGNALATVLHPASEYRGSIAFDADDHVVTQTSGFSQEYLDRRSLADQPDFFTNFPTGSSGAAECALAIAGTGEIELLSDTGLLQWGAPFLLQRFTPSGAVIWTFDGGNTDSVSFGPLGVQPNNIAAGATGNIALVGEYRDLRGTVGWVQVFHP